MATKDTENLVVIDPTTLSRNQTFQLFRMINQDPERYDENTNVITEHIAQHAFKWVKEAEAEGDHDQVDLLESVFLPDDYCAEGIWYDAAGWRYDWSDYTVTDLNGVVSFDECSWLDADPGRWNLVEEGARLASIDVDTNATAIQGLAVALSILSKDCAQGVTDPSRRPGQEYWMTFIIEFAGENYENGVRLS